MTEAEWLGGTDPQAMLKFLGSKGSDRKLRLFACGCCRRIQDLFPKPDLLHHVETSEQVADDEIDRECLEGSWNLLRLTSEYHEEGPPYAINAVWSAVDANAMDAARGAAEEAAAAREDVDETDKEELAAQAALLRDIFGNPFRPVTVDPAWQTATVVSLAQAIYAERAFDRLPILADALEDAGCGNQDILEHCRQPGEHVRGCWVVDLILSKDR
jgi:hypothetical protein